MCKLGKIISWNSIFQKLYKWMNEWTRKSRKLHIIDEIIKKNWREKRHLLLLAPSPFVDAIVALWDLRSTMRSRDDILLALLVTTISCQHHHHWCNLLLASSLSMPHVFYPSISAYACTTSICHFGFHHWWSSSSCRPKFLALSFSRAFLMKGWCTNLVSSIWFHPFSL